MTKEKQQFFSHGNFFDDEEEFFKFVKEWPDLPFDLEEFKRQMNFRIKEAEINNEIREGKMTNREAYKIFRLATDWAVEEKND